MSGISFQIEMFYEAKMITFQNPKRTYKGALDGLLQQKKTNNLNRYFSFDLL